MIYQKKVIFLNKDILIINAMKIKKYLLSGLVVLTVFYFSGCKNDEAPLPQPDFTYTGHDLPAPCTVTFTNSSVNSVRYVWDFGDGDSSTVTNPVHVFQEGGTYPVTLTAFNEEDDSQSVTKNIDIGTQPFEARFVKITINDLPLLDAGGGIWDPGTDADTLPDVIFIINTQTGSPSDPLFPLQPATPVVKTNVGAADLPISWEYTASTAYIINKNEYSDITFYFYIYEWDSPSIWDNIGGSIGPFNLGNYIGTYPTQIDTTMNNISLTFNLEWPTN